MIFLDQYPPWSDYEGKVQMSFDYFKLPEGWKWSDDWNIEKDQNTDENGYFHITKILISW
jgi:hypothetical protein